MLDIVPSAENRPCSMMSLDLSPYLLSASPPVSEFSLHSLSLATNYKPYSFFSPPPSRPPPSCARVVYGTTSCAGSPPKSIMSVTSPKDDPSISCDSTSSKVSQESCQSVKLKKHVSFADDSGFPLTEVRLMLDNPSAPPVLSMQGLSGLSRECQAAVLKLEDSDDDDHDHYNPSSSFVLPDPQPWARPHFDEDLHRNLVGVENVYMTDHDLVCSVFVDKRPEPKRVFGRCTLDSWNTFQDVTATYCQVRRPGYDTYQFTLTVPATADRSHPIEFAVCFEADGVQHWDNNEGKNFVIHWRQDQAKDKSLSGYLEPSQTSSDLSALVWCSQTDIDQPYK